jgi:small subunit ribosomal protein S21
MTNILVEVRAGQIEGALRLLKKQMEQQGIYHDIKKKNHYLKPSERRKLKSRLARKKLRKQEQKRALAEEQRDNYLLRHSRKGNP